MIQDCKIKVNPEESRIVQEIAFDHGYEWAVHKRQICHREAPYLFIDNSDMTINYSDSEEVFKNVDKPQISFQEFFEKYALKNREIQPFKIEVNPSQSRIVQNTLFARGKTWCDDTMIVCHENDPYLFFDEDGLSYVGQKKYSYFHTHKLPQITFDEFIEKYATSRKKIIGYRPKPDAPIDAIDSLSDCGSYNSWKSKNHDYYSMDRNEISIENFRKHGVLDLWFDPVYEKQDITMPFGNTLVAINKSEKEGFIKVNGVDYRFTYQEVKEVIEWYDNRPKICSYEIDFRTFEINFGCVKGTLSELRAIAHKFKL